MLINLKEKNSHANSFFVRNMTCIPMSYFNSEGRIRELKGRFVDESQICGLFLLSCKPRDSRDVSNGADSFFSTLVSSELHMWTRASGRSTDNMYSGYKTLVLIEISVFVGKQ